MAASDAISPAQKRRGLMRWQAQMMAAPFDYNTRTVEDAARFARDNDPGSYQDYDPGADYDDYGGEGGGEY